MSKKMVYLLYSTLLALGVLASFFFNSTNQKIMLTVLLTVTFIFFYIYNKKVSKS